MFFESVFGTCLACKAYNLFTRHTAQHCPGRTRFVVARRQLNCHVQSFERSTP